MITIIKNFLSDDKLLRGLMITNTVSLVFSVLFVLSLVFSLIIGSFGLNVSLLFMMFLILTQIQESTLKIRLEIREQNKGSDKDE